MEVLTTKDAAGMLGISVRQWHYLTDKHGIEPVAQAGGVRGAMVWTPEQIELVRSLKAEAA